MQDSIQFSWERYKQHLWFDQELGVLMDLSRMGMPADSMATHEAALNAAIAFMGSLEKGATGNPDENRMVGHYWLRDPELAPDPEIKAEILETQRRVRAFAGKVRNGLIRPAIPGVDGFRHLLVIGIGGSALGPQFVADALGWAEDAMEPSFLDNTDPGGFDKVLQAMEPWIPQTLVVVISKSGTTQEIQNAMMEAILVFKRMGVDLAKHAVAVTGRGSALEARAREDGFLEVFPMWDWVGGRTSEFSAVGLLPAALQGLDVDALLQGAREMDQRTRVSDPRKNPAALLAAAWHDAGEGRGRRDMVVLAYKDRLLLLGRYLQQLVMESLGKQVDLDGNTVHQGLSVYGNKGTTDQHALVQQLREGPDNYFATFIEVLSDRAGKSMMVKPDTTAGDYLLSFLLGTRHALSENGRRSLTITLPDVSAHAVGMLIALFERAVGIYAHMINVNAYNQPGVEAGKKAAERYVAVQSEALAALRSQPSRQWTIEGLCRELNVPDQEEAVFKLMEHAAANPDHGIRKTPGDFPWKATYAFREE